jgi:hypothetical protein
MGMVKRAPRIPPRDVAFPPHFLWECGTNAGEEAAYVILPDLRTGDTADIGELLFFRRTL